MAATPPSDERKSDTAARPATRRRRLGPELRPLRLQSPRMEDADHTAVALGLEHQVWRALQDGDGEADSRLLADDFLGVYPTGLATRDEHVAQLAVEPSVFDYSITSASTIAITSEELLLTYDVTYRRTADGPVERMFVSSLWSHRDGRWRNTFSQDTPAASTPESDA